MRASFRSALLVRGVLPSRGGRGGRGPAPTSDTATDRHTRRGLASGAGWGARGVGTGSGHPLSPASSISPPSPPLRPGLPKVEEVVSLALSLPPFVYMLSTTGGGRGHADAGGGGVALQLCKLPFHSHKALPGGGGCPRLQNSSSHQLTDTRGCTQVGPAAPRKPRTPTQLPGLGFWRTLKPLPSFVKLQPRERKRWGGGGLGNFANGKTLSLDRDQQQAPKSRTPSPKF